MTKPDEKPPAEELARLRKLVKSAEWSAASFAMVSDRLWTSGVCPWCRDSGVHSEGCEVFTPKGELK